MNNVAHILTLRIQPHLSLSKNGIKMTFQKFKSDGFCVGGRHRSTTTKIYGNITIKGNKVLIGYSSNFIRKKSMTVSDNTIQAEVLGDFFKNLG